VTGGDIGLLIVAGVTLVAVGAIVRAGGRRRANTG
jgi:hypothetical protein